MFKKILILGIVFSLVSVVSLFAQTIVKDDFRVNDDFNIGGSNQRMPAMAMDHQGNFMVVWLDERNTLKDIYGQRFDRQGNPLGRNFKVNGAAGEGKASAYNFGVAMDAKGDFVVVWEHYKGYKADIYAQRYSSDGLPIGDNFKISDDPMSSPQFEPAVAMNSSGEFITVWKDYREGKLSIYGQRYSSNGEAVGSNFKIISTEPSRIGVSGRPQISVAISPNGESVVAWVTSPSSYQIDVHAVRLNAKNQIVGSELKVTESDSLSFAFSPDVGMDAAGDFVIAWWERGRGLDEIYAARYSSEGEIIDTNFRVNDETGRTSRGFPRVGLNASKKFVIGWLDSRDGKMNPYLQYYNQFGEPEGRNSKIRKIESAASWSLCLSKTPSGYLALAWEGPGCSYNSDILATVLDQKGELVKGAFMVNDDLGSSSQNNPAIAASSSGRFVISWDDRRFCRADIIAQRFGSSGEFLGSNFTVNRQSYETSFSASSSTAMDSSGNSVIVFSGFYGVFFQRYDYSGQELGEHTQVNQIAPVYWEPVPDVSMNFKGDFSVVWNQTIDPLSRCIFAQALNSEGDKIDSNLMVNTFIDNTEHFDNPKVAQAPGGSFLVAWHSSHQNDYESAVWGQLCNSSGERIGGNFKISDSTVSPWNLYPDVGVDREGNFVVAWSSGWNVLVQRLGADGSKIGKVIKAVGHVKTETEKVSLAVKPTGEFLVAWSDFRNLNWDIYAQRFDSEGNPLGGNFRVNSDQGDNTQMSPVVAADDKNYYFAWVDNRNLGSGFDIFAKIISFEPTFVSEPGASTKPEFTLLQNYPNPFNPTTTIPFKVGGSQLMVHSPIRTTLKIYNILGQKVITLVDEDKLPGSYQVIWDGKNEEDKDVSSGVYFYVIKTKDLVQTKKMTLLR